MSKNRRRSWRQLKSPSRPPKLRPVPKTSVTPAPPAIKQGLRQAPCSAPELCDTCGHPFNLMIELSPSNGPEKGIAYAVVADPFQVYHLDAWLECDECEMSESLGDLGDLNEATVADLRSLGEAEGWQVFEGHEPEFERMASRASKRSRLDIQRELQRAAR